MSLISEGENIQGAITERKGRQRVQKNENRWKK